jgi:pilus assembly protein CpaB
MRSKTIILLVLALGCGLVASIGISQVLNRNQDAGSPEETAAVWVALADIKSGDLLTPQNLKLEQWPKEKIPPGSLGKLEQIEGKHTRAAIYQGEVVVEKKLRVSGTSAADTIPTGFRAYTVQGDTMNSHGGLLHPGDRVDVLVYVNKSSGTVETGTKTILQDIKVFAVNDQTSPPDEKSIDAITAKTVTLLMTPSQAEKAALAAEIGKIRLVIRAPDDKSPVNPAGTTLGDLFMSEKTNRDEEEMNKPVSNKKGAGLLEMLSQAYSQPPKRGAAPVAVAADEQSFTMQIIKGTDIMEADFRKLSDSSRWESGPIATAAAKNPPADSPSVDKPAPKKEGGGHAPAVKKDGPRPDGPRPIIDSKNPIDSKNNDTSPNGAHA